MNEAGSFTSSFIPVTRYINVKSATSIVDALLIVQFYVGLVTGNFVQEAADVNCDGVIDIMNTLVTAQYYVGLVPSLES